jgi:FAD/FMN-containing dehydrogenase/Fe-S oxidoreductase
VGAGKRGGRSRRRARPIPAAAGVTTDLPDPEGRARSGPFPHGPIAGVLTPDRIAADLASRVRGDVHPDIVRRAAFSTDASIYRVVPACVVAPRDAADVAAVVRYAAEQGLPVAPRGAGTGLAGESLCAGIVLDMTRYMNRILAIVGDTVTCEPGVVLDGLNRRLRPLGRMIGPDPSSASRATIGGAVSNNATGAHSLLYGHMDRWVEAVQVVLASGSIVEFRNDMDATGSTTGSATGSAPGSATGSAPGSATGSATGSTTGSATDPPAQPAADLALACARLLGGAGDVIRAAWPAASRNRCGYGIAGVARGERMDMARLLTGSEGTLAIFTRITLRTVRLPAARGLIQLEFDSLEAMARAVPAIVATGPAACELMDGSLIRLALDQLPAYRDILPAGAAAVLLVEHFGDTDGEVMERIRATERAVAGRATRRTVITDPAAQARVWKSRKDAGPLLYRERSRKHPAEFMEDVAVPPDRLADYVAGLQRIGRERGIAMAFFGHAGDGELHVRPYLDLGDPADRDTMRAMADEVYTLAWSLGGTISGEHAVGLVRAAYVRRQYGDACYDLFRQLKDLFDPAGILNPGKILGDDPGVLFRDLRRQRPVLPQQDCTPLLFREDELELELDHCYGCGLCLARDPALRMCPVYRANGEEVGSSRAKANLLHFRATGQLDDAQFESPEFRAFLDLCVHCRMCDRECPSGTRIATLVAAARAEVVRRKGLRRAEYVLSRSRFPTALASRFAPLANRVLDLHLSRQLLERVAGLDASRRPPPFAAGSFLPAGRRYLARCGPVDDPVARVAYFADTFVTFHDHALGFAVLDVLRYNGVEVVIPPQRPAPLPAIVYGDFPHARRDLAYNVRHLARAARDGYTIVCSEPSAAVALRKELRHFVTGDDADLVARSTVELMAFLDGLREAGRLLPPPSPDDPVAPAAQERPLAPPSDPAPGPFAYHRPCHLGAVSDDAVTLRLLREHFGVQVHDLQAGCCGLAGTYGMQRKNRELSDAMAESLRAALAGAAGQGGPGAAAPGLQVVTECAACRLQIEHLGSQVAHPARLMARSYGL